MVTAVSGQLDTPGCYRVFNRLRLRTSNTEYWSHIPQDQGRKGGTRSGDCRIDYKGGSGRSRFLPGKVRQFNVHCAKEGRKMEAGPQPEVLEPIRQQGAFQVGGYQKPQRYSTSGRLHGQIGSQRSLSLGSDGLSKQEVPTVPLEGQASPIHLPSLRTHQRPVCFHKAASPSSSLSERTGNPLPHVHRRYVDPRRDQRGAEPQFSVLSDSDDLTRFRREQRKVNSRSHSRDRILGICHQFEIDDPGSDEGEAEIIDFTMQESIAVSTDNSPPSGSGDWHHDFPEPSSPSSTLALQGLTRAQKRISGPPPLIRFSGLAESESDDGFEVVDRSWESVESGTDSHQPTSPNNTVGRLRPGLGCNLFVLQGCDRGSLEQSGAASPYQLQGAPSSMAGSPVLCQEHEKLSCSSEDRQYSSSSVYQQDGRCTFERSLPVGTQDVELVHRPPYNHLSGTSTRFAESSSGQGIEVQGGLFRMGSRQSYLRTVDGQERPLYSRPLCLPSLCKASHLLQLEIGSRGDSSECPVPTLGDVNRLCFPTFLLDMQVLGQDHLRECPSDNPHNSPLEITSVVPSHLANVGGDTTTTTKPQENINRPTGEKSSHGATGSSSVSRLDCVRSSLQDRGLSENAIKLICASWRSNTEASYSRCWRVWVNWCSKQGVNPINTSVEKIIEFLSVQFNQGKQYSTLNSYRSSISVTHMPVDGVQLGKHPLISRLMKGVFHLRPPQPRYAGRWDVSKVLQFLEEKGNTESLSMKDLT